ncbi:MAG: hypothetical protein ACI8Y7_000175 [Candidatus Woesearchaeota archaeon]|jgi:hypothetical protein
MISEDQVFVLVQQKGPLLPTDITSELGESSMIVGAMLSSLVKLKKVLITHAKWGGSPLYYVSEQYEQIQKVYPHLNAKDCRAFDLLKEKKVLRDSDQTPLVRTGLRALQDFAKPIQVKLRTGQELFWRWYLISNEEAITVLRGSVKKPITPAQVQEKPIPAPKPPVVSVMRVEEKPKLVIKPPVAKPQPLVSKPVTPAPVVAEQTTIPLTDINDDFFLDIQKKLRAKSVTVLSCDVVRKNSELDLRIEIPTNVGKATYYAKAKKKKKSNDGDLSQAFVKGQLQHLPAAYITTGELTKKAQDLLSTDFASILVVTL